MRMGKRFAVVSCIALMLSLVVVHGVLGVTFEDPDNFGEKRTWSGSSLSVPGNLGGMLFSDDGQTLYVVGNSEASNSALYAVPLTRDAVTKEVTDMGPAGDVTRVFSGAFGISGLDAGWDVGSEGTLFYTYWSANFLGERPGGVSGAETLCDMEDVGLPSSVAGLTFSPYIEDPNTSFGMMQVSVWGSNRTLYNIPLDPLGGGIFKPQGVEVFVNLPRQGTGAIQYIPSGPLQGDMMYVNWDYGEVWILQIDAATGLPIDDTTGSPTLGTSDPRVQLFASGLGSGPWGLEFDPLTNDFFVSTWGGSPYNTIIQIGGKGLPPPELDITVGSLPDGVEGEPYTATVQTKGGVPPYTWLLSGGTFPPGLDFDPLTGGISGTPTEGGDFTFTVQVMDSDDPQNTDEKEFTITVAPVVGGPTVRVSSTTVEFPDACLGGENPPDQTIEVWNGGGGKLYWSTVINPVDRLPIDANIPDGILQGDQSGAEWLTVDPTGGSSTGVGNKGTVTFSADVSGIAEAGEYTAVVRFFDSQAAPGDLPSESYADVTVRLRVEVCAEPDLEVEPNEVAFAGVCAGAENPPDQTVEVWNAGGGVLNWTATVMSDLVSVREQPASVDGFVGWLSVEVEPVTGVSTGPEDRATVTLRANIAGLSDGQYTAVVRFVNDNRAEEDFEDVTVSVQVGSATITVRSNIEADYVLRRIADGLQTAGRTQATEDPKVFESIHRDIAAGQWEIGWIAQANAWPKAPVTEVKTLPGCGTLLFTKDYIVQMPSDLYQLIIEPINYATGTFTARVRIKNVTGEENPPARTFTAPIWLVVKEIVFTVAGPHSEGRLWNADGMTSAVYPDSGDYYYMDVSEWAPLEPGELSPEVELEFYIKDRNPNFKPVIEVWADDPVVSAASAFRVERVLCGPSGSILVQWDSEAGATYVVEAADSVMGPWTEVSNELLCNGGLAEWADSPPEGVRCRFYRVRLLSP
jgi:hypothetical protein